MLPAILGFHSKWDSLVPLVLINVVMLMTVVVFAFIHKKRPRDPDLAGRVTSKWLGPFLYEYWAWFIRPFEDLFIKLKLTPNFLTTVGFLLSAGSGWAFATGHMGIAGWLMIIGGSCDMFDGRIARRTGMSSQSGAFYDSVMDRFGEAVVFLGLAAFYHDSWVLYFVIAGMAGSMMVSYTRAKGDGMGIECKVGVMQRPERIVYLGVGSIFSPPFRQIVNPNAEVSVEYLTIAAIILIAVLTWITAIYRMIYIIRKIKISEGKPIKKPDSHLLRKFTHRYLDI